ncbi:BTB/POZ and MATH domain-containing protein 3-like [Aegilops tauschii subsp. strangulata]|uniref:BTB/POZ and MATH domain-containing protein 3-like n=1 Tax=Aegilops tauschii subsp. strangulata TaxID=200361 RepID=UPI001ABCB98F|nr:BTB/POZ and MATH domain-containing protein 3-like [Aegilops tauschii subsp. strangulata]
MSNTAASAVASRSGDEPSLTASSIVAKVVGSHILRIDGYSYTKELGTSITSEMFTVGGHRWCLRYYPDGNGKNYSDWISVFLRLDHTNVNEVKAKFRISLLDQDGNPVPSYSRQSGTCTFSLKQGANNAEWGCFDFIKRSNLEGSVYLNDDVFSVRCDVTVVNTKAIPVPAVRRSV